MIKYFLAALTIPENDLWVNLSPYEKDRMINDDLGKTEMGRDMLAQDYLLKQLTASMIYPEKDLGKAFWNRVYDKAREEYGTTDIPVDTFNKVWIVADKARVVEHNNAAYVTAAHLKVMLDTDYEAMSHQKDIAESSAPAGDEGGYQKDIAEPSAPAGGKSQENALTNGGHSAPLQDNERGSVSPSTLPRELALDTKATQVAHRFPNDNVAKGVSDISKEIIREIILPEIEKEVNEGRNFATLRQMFYAMILATWYKNSLKDALLNQVYTDKVKTSGVLSDDPNVGEKIYQQYLEAYKKGIFNYIKDESVGAMAESPLLSTPRQYFSGGLELEISSVLDLAQVPTPSDLAQLQGKSNISIVVEIKGKNGLEDIKKHALDAAMEVMLKVSHDPELVLGMDANEIVWLAKSLDTSDPETAASIAALARFAGLPEYKGENAEDIEGGSLLLIEEPGTNRDLVVGVVLKRGIIFHIRDFAPDYSVYTDILKRLERDHVIKSGLHQGVKTLPVLTVSASGHVDGSYSVKLNFVQQQGPEFQTKNDVELPVLYAKRLPRVSGGGTSWRDSARESVAATLEGDFGHFYLGSTLAVDKFYQDLDEMLKEHGQDFEFSKAQIRFVAVYFQKSPVFGEVITVPVAVVSYERGLKNDKVNIVSLASESLLNGWIDSLLHFAHKPIDVFLALPNSVKKIDVDHLALDPDSMVNGFFSDPITDEIMEDFSYVKGSVTFKLTDMAQDAGLWINPDMDFNKVKSVMRDIGVRMVRDNELGDAIDEIVEQLREYIYVKRDDPQLRVFVWDVFTQALMQQGHRSEKSNQLMVKFIREFDRDVEDIRMERMMPVIVRHSNGKQDSWIDVGVQFINGFIRTAIIEGTAKRKVVFSRSLQVFALDGRVHNTFDRQTFISAYKNMAYSRKYAWPLVYAGMMELVFEDMLNAGIIVRLGYNGSRGSAEYYLTDNGRGLSALMAIEQFMLDAFTGWQQAQSSLMPEEAVAWWEEKLKQDVIQMATAIKDIGVLSSVIFRFNEWYRSLKPGVDYSPEFLNSDGPAIKFNEAILQGLYTQLSLINVRVNIPQAAMKEVLLPVTHKEDIPRIPEGLYYLSEYLDSEELGPPMKGHFSHLHFEQTPAFRSFYQDLNNMVSIDSRVVALDKNQPGFLVMYTERPDSPEAELIQKPVAIVSYSKGGDEDTATIVPLAEMAFIKAWRAALSDALDRSINLVPLSLNALQETVKVDALKLDGTDSFYADFMDDFTVDAVSWMKGFVRFKLLDKTKINNVPISQSGFDAAQKAVAPGGIDLDAAKMKLDVAQDGKGIKMSLDSVMLAAFKKGNFTGVEGIILRIEPIQTPLQFLGF
ncbi:MAG: hypothetical protein V2A70_02805 [Candidatus Omnitrophota bacterium]